MLDPDLRGCKPAARLGDARRSPDVDQRPALESPVSNERMCVAVVTLADELLERLKRGKQLTVVFKPKVGGITALVPLDGFSGAFAALQKSGS